MASYVIPYHTNNKLFDVDDEHVNRDNCAFFAYNLRNSLKDYDVHLSTHDIHPIDKSDIVIYHDMPRTMPNLVDIDKSYLLIFESEVIMPQNFDIERHKYFRKIFTWHDDFVDSQKYIKMNFTHKFPDSYAADTNRKYLCTMIAGNKTSTHPLELYSKRLEAIRWFEAHHPEHFDLYGMGWNYTDFPSYKGSVERKLDVLMQYRFAICYENARDIPGYITEKIFDCFFAGCVPVYLGPMNVDKYIPANTFIDVRQFDSYTSLYDYLSNMSEAEYQQYRRNIWRYLSSPKALPFTAQHFSDTVIQNIL